METPQSAPIPCQTIIGLMSGTSLDGLDVAQSQFSRTADGRVHGALKGFHSEPFPAPLRSRLEALYTASAREWVACAADFSTWCGEVVNRLGWEASAIGFHGQTVFHEPEARFTGQLASGAHLHAATGLPVVCDFRSLDVALGGQGAPLVPVADALLYPEAEVAINLGGIANISDRNARTAWDIAPCNLVLNRLAAWGGEACDWNGRRAAVGRPIPELAEALRNLPYHLAPPPKSLGREDVDRDWWPLFEQFSAHPVDDLLATAVADMVHHISRAAGPRSVLFTGGGTWNAALMSGLRAQQGVTVLEASAFVVDGKEAHAFALLAWLRIHGLSNTWASVTGAPKDSVGGCIYGDTRHLLA